MRNGARPRRGARLWRRHRCLRAARRAVRLLPELRPDLLLEYQGLRADDNLRRDDLVTEDFAWAGLAPILPDRLSGNLTSDEGMDMSETQPANIGVIGMAVMGSNLARNLARNGHRVAVYNRTTAKVDEFLAGGASVRPS